MALLVVAALLGSSCRDEGAVRVSEDAVTRLEVSLSEPEMRTSLGERTEDSYPLYWSADDRVSINGKVSSSAEIDPSNPRKATFSIEGGVSHPLSVLYPASESGRVRFVAEQRYSRGTFDASAMPMYGYAADGEGVALRHLCALLRFDVRGGVTLASVTITAEQGDLAADYAIDCASGALSDKTEASRSVRYTFGEGLTLSSQEQPFYISLPAGSYGVCTVEILATSGARMTLHFDSDSDKALRAGVVREFKPVTFKEGSECVLEDMQVEVDTMLIPVHLRAMAYNVRNCKGMDDVTDYQRVADVINSMNVDIVALQELDSCTTRASKRYVLGILAEKTGMHPTFCASIDYSGGTYGNGILSKEKPLSVRRVPLPCSDEPRSMLIVEMKDYYYCSTHLSLLAEYRRASVEIIVDELSKLDKPALIGGDFNAKRSAESMQNLAQYCHLFKKEISSYTYPADEPTKEIDFIALYKTEGLYYELNSHFVVNAPVESDHRPIVADLAVCLTK